MIIFTHLKCFYFCSYSFKNYFYLKNSYCNKNHHKKCFHYKVQAPQNVIYHFQKWNVLTWFLCQTCGEIQLHNGDTQENRHDFCGVAKRTLKLQHGGYLFDIELMTHRAVSGDFLGTLFFEIVIFSYRHRGSLGVRKLRVFNTSDPLKTYSVESKREVMIANLLLARIITQWKLLSYFE